jgi:peptidoglycan/LPS O-acetylase OafA/YrhL
MSATPTVDALRLSANLSPAMAMARPAIQSRVAAMDGLRGVAILALLTGHFLPGGGLDAPHWSVNFGRVGVELFFALSGCLMGVFLFHQQMPLAKFAVRRFARIVPSLWLFVATASVVMLWRDSSSLSHGLQAALGLSNYAPVAGWGYPAVRYGHLWSVGLELQGYLVLGLVAAVARYTGLAPTRLIMPLLVAVWALIAATTLGNYGAEDYYSTFLRAEYRLTAMLLAAALVESQLAGRNPLHSLGPWPLWMLAGLLLQSNALPDAVKYTLGSAALALGCAQVATLPPEACGHGLHRWLTNGWLVELGTVSYSIYLWQQLFYAEKGALHWPVALALAVGLGGIVHYLWDNRLHHRISVALESGLGLRAAQH